MANWMIKAAAFSAALVMTAAFLAPAAEARGFARGGQRGAIGGYNRQGAYGQSVGAGGFAYGRGAAGFRAHRFNGPNGGSYTGGHGGIIGQNGGLVGRRFSGTGPNGGTAAGGGVAGWKKGVGGFEHTSRNITGPNGSNYTGSTTGKYNAQTGQGTFDSSRQLTDAQNGKNYGYTDNSSFTKGQGGTTTLDTDNHGDYTINWQQGQKPVVTPIPPSSN